MSLRACRFTQAGIAVCALVVMLFFGAQQALADEVVDTALKAGGTQQVVTAKPRVLGDGVYTFATVGKSGYSVAVKKASLKNKAVVRAEKTLTSDWAQKWVVVQDPASGYYTIRNLNSRRMLAVSGKVKSGAVVKQVKQSASNKQLWELSKVSGKTVFKPASNPNLALTLVNAKKATPTLKLKAFSGKKAQRFKARATNAIDSAHSYFVRNVQSQAGLAVKKASKKNGAKLVMAKKSSAKEQKFRLYESGSSFTMQNVNSCRYVAASKSAMKQSAKNKGKARKWDFVLDLRTGLFSIKSRSTGKYVEARGSAASLRSATGLPAQQFQLVQTYGFKLFVDPGHGPNSSGYGVYDPGASGTGRDEADLTTDLANRIETKLAGTDVMVCNGADYRVPYWQRNSKANSLGCDAVLSIHFDAGGGGSTSTMIGTRGPVSASSAFNKIIHSALVSSVGLRDGGTSHRSDITVVNGSVPAVLMEVCFIDNSSSLYTYLNRKNSVAESLAEGVLEASRKLAVLQ